MSDLTPELAPQIIAACQAGAEEAAEALSRALGSELTLAVGAGGTWSSDSPREGHDGPGLAILLQFGEAALAALLPESSGLVPDWCAAPDATGESQLSTLAQELGMLVVPETLLADDFQARHVDNLLQALQRGGVSDGAGLVPLELKCGDTTAELALVWPLSSPADFFPAAAPEEPAADKGDAQTAETPETAPPIEPNHRPTSFAQLPDYSRSLLRVSVPVRVVLAAKREFVLDVVEMAPGTIIKFDKPCDEMLDLYVGNMHVAQGEAVKIGEKFGFRVNSMVLPPEHFKKVHPRNAS